MPLQGSHEGLSSLDKTEGMVAKRDLEPRHRSFDGPSLYACLCEQGRCRHGEGYLRRCGRSRQRCEPGSPASSAIRSLWSILTARVRLPPGSSGQKLWKPFRGRNERNCNLSVYRVVCACGGGPKRQSVTLFGRNAESLSCFATLRARNVNDIVTINVIENSTATNSANTSTAEEGRCQLSRAVIVRHQNSGEPLAGQIPAWISRAREQRRGPPNSAIRFQRELRKCSREWRPRHRRNEASDDQWRTPGPQGSRESSGSTTSLANNVVLSTAIANMEVVFDGKGIVSRCEQTGASF